MNTQEVANRLVELCRAGKHDQVHQELFTDQTWSIEMEGMPMQKVQGWEALKQKGDHFNQSFEIRGIEVSDPIVAGDHFSCTMKLDAVNRESGQQVPMDEICVYKVKDGKILSEQFFYPMESEEDC